jgi:hypothetical protein
VGKRPFISEDLDSSFPFWRLTVLNAGVSLLPEKGEPMSVLNDGDRNEAMGTATTVWMCGE